MNKNTKSPPKIVGQKPNTTTPSAFSVTLASGRKVLIHERQSCLPASPEYYERGYTEEALSDWPSSRWHAATVGSRRQRQYTADWVWATKTLKGYHADPAIWLDRAWALIVARPRDEARRGWLTVSKALLVVDHKAVPEWARRWSGYG